MSDATWNTALHEAGHFAFASIARFLGPSKLLTIDPARAAIHGREGKKTQGVLSRTPSTVERLLRMESRGHAIDTLFSDTAEGRMDRSAYQQGKPMVVREIVLEAFAGSAADSTIGTRDGTFNESDYMQARNAALLMMRDDELPKYFTLHYERAKLLCRGPLRPAILAIAERLMKQRTIEGGALHSLWIEVSPGPVAL